MLEKIINTIDPRKIRWWEKDEWYEEKTFDLSAHYVDEEHGCPSWDIEVCDIILYKNKETCEERVRYQRQRYPWSKTVFENPKNQKISWFEGAFETRDINQFDIYEGPDWERK